MPDWALFLTTVAVAKALVVLGLMILWRTGLVSFGQALYFGAGGYAAGLAGLWLGLSDAILLVLLGGAVAARGRLGGRPAARALPRDLLRHAEPRLLDDPLWPAGEHRGAGQHRRRQRRPADLLRLCAAGPAQVRARLSPDHRRRAGRGLPGPRLSAVDHRPARRADPRQRDPGRVPRRLGARRDPPEGGDRRRAGRASAAC